MNRQWLGILLGLAIGCSPSPVFALPTPPANISTWDFFPCGLRLGKRQLLPSVMVRGQEDSQQAIANWAIPWQTLITTLKITTKTLGDGQIEVRTSSKIAIIPASAFTDYPELGRTITIAALEQFLDIKASFDLIDYSIVLTLPTSGNQSLLTAAERPIELTGLPRQSPPAISLTALEQQVGLENSSGQGTLKATGTLGGASWFAQFNQTRPLDQLQIGLGDAQIVKYSDYSDYILGGQPAFWNRQESNNYWGISGLWREGFAPAPSLEGHINPTERRQSGKLGRSIVGNATPGTIVRLVTLDHTQIMAEILVDRTGVYRFEDVPVTSNSSNYRLLLFPDGQLSAIAEVRNVNFVTTPGQLPPGATSTMASIGLRRQAGGFFGEFQDLRGAVVRHQGVNEWLTVGAGLAYDRGWQGIGEVFIQPNGMPLEGSLALAGDDLVGRVCWNPSSQVRAEWNTDRFSQRASLDWQAQSNLSFQAQYDNRDALGVGFQYSAIRGIDNQSLVRASLTSQGAARWLLRQRWGQWVAENRGNETSNHSQLTYLLSPDYDSNSNLQLNHQSSSGTPFTTLSWNYRSSQRLYGKYPVELELGYGIGQAGGGWLGGAALTLWPGVSLRGRYQTGITSDRSNFSLELLSNLEVQDKIQGQPYPIEQLRTQGGIAVIPFFDRNGNDLQDPGEESYLDLELLALNYRPCKFYRPVVGDGRVSLRLPPGQYRLDFDPAGFPADWRTPITGYAVEVAAGSYTVVRVPLVAAYQVHGILRTPQGQPIIGAKVSAWNQTGQEMAFSITNSQGEYYLEALPLGSYRLQVEERRIAIPLQLAPGQSTEQELNLVSERLDVH
jgi:Carboxypeptidase regulatory-like domain